MQAAAVRVFNHLPNALQVMLAIEAKEETTLREEYLPMLTSLSLEALAAIAKDGIVQIWGERIQEAVEKKEEEDLRCRILPLMGEYCLETELGERVKNGIHSIWRERFTDLEKAEDEVS